MAEILALVGSIIAVVQVANRVTTLGNEFLGGKRRKQGSDGDDRHHLCSLSNLVVALNNAMEQWSYFYCDVVRAGALTIARGDQ